MLAILYALGMFVVDLFKSWGRLEAENLTIRSLVTRIVVSSRLNACRNPMSPSAITYLPLTKSQLVRRKRPRGFD